MKTGRFRVKAESKTRRSFRAVFEPDDGGWHVYLPEVQGCRTWGKTLPTARANIREALSTCVDVFANADKIARDATFVVELKLPEGLDKDLAQYQVERLQAEEKAEALRARYEAIARKLVNKVGLSLRDTGELLGVSQEAVRKTAARKTKGGTT